jgi:hypothetical protein
VDAQLKVRQLLPTMRFDVVASAIDDDSVKRLEKIGKQLQLVREVVELSKFEEKEFTE